MGSSHHKHICTESVQTGSSLLGHCNYDRDVVPFRSTIITLIVALHCTQSACDLSSLQSSLSTSARSPTTSRRYLDSDSSANSGEAGPPSTESRTSSVSFTASVNLLLYCELCTTICTRYDNVSIPFGEYSVYPQPSQYNEWCQHDPRNNYYDDGYGGYPGATPNPFDAHPSPSPNPYEHEHQQFQPIHPDPFAISQQGPPPPNLYHSPPQMPVASPPPQVGEYLNPFQNNYHPNSPPAHPVSPPIPRSQSTMQSYALHDGPSYDTFGERAEEVDQDTGDIPLLRRDNPPLVMPGEYDPVTADDKSESNIRYGHIPQRVPRRYKTIKKVELFHGNFVLDSPVPTKLLNMCAQKNEREFTHMRYSAATCDPNDFKDSGFTLRQVHYDPPRRTELFIVMTMYNEDEELFCRTMHGVMKNIAHLCKRDRSKTWGKEGWKKVVVCIVSDGRQKINSRTLSVIATSGAYQDGIAKVRLSADATLYA